MKKCLPPFLLLLSLLLSLPVLAENAKQQVPKQDQDSLSNTFLRGKQPIEYHPTPGGRHAAQKMAAAAAMASKRSAGSSSCVPDSFVLSCADTITHFSGAFDSPGISANGTPQGQWFYSMVGKAPSSNATTTFNSPIIPVTIDMRNADGTARFVITDTTNCPNCKPNQLGKKIRLISRPDSIVTPFVNGPGYATTTYTSSPDPTQLADAELRAGFGNKAGPNYHNLLNPQVDSGLTMALLGGSYFYSLNNNGSCCAFVLVDAEVFQDELFPNSTPPDSSTVIGAAEVAGEITTKDISTFLFNNVYLYEGVESNCCVLGFHTFDSEIGDASNGNRERFYVLNYSSWIGPDLFSTPAGCAADPDNCFLDVTAHSHEMAETFNDPFVGYDGVHNIVPWWFSGSASDFQCQDLLEVGDVVEVLDDATVPITVNNLTYHPQTVALLPWFEFQSPSTAINGAYSYPNENALPSLSPPEGVNCAP